MLKASQLLPLVHDNGTCLFLQEKRLASVPSVAPNVLPHPTLFSSPQGTCLRDIAHSSSGKEGHEGRSQGGAARGQAATEKLRRQYKDAYLNKMLADSWKAGEAWAGTDVQGLELSSESCAAHHTTFHKVPLHLPPSILDRSPFSCTAVSWSH